MSREDTDTSVPVSPVASEPRPVLPQSRASSYLHSLQRAEQSASTPFDSDWVSPFTLAPLPTFPRNRGQQSTPKSPEQHRRSNSSLFYAAAWGSPYATPSPQQSADPKHSAGKSLDLSRPSPSKLGSDWLQSLSSTGASVAKYLRSPETKPSAVPLTRRNTSQPPDKNRSERENWLSDSEGSDVEGLDEDIIKTPTRTLFAKLRAGSFGKSFSHRAQESIETVTPENFNAPPLPAKELKAISTIELSNMAAVGEMHDRFSEVNTSPGKEKPLPMLPRRQSSITKIENFAGSPTSPSRPPLASLQSRESFSRPKKQVLWKGKKCIIALPLQEPEEAGLAPALSPADVQERLRKWEVQGFDINGFVLGDSIDGDSFRGSGHSRPLFPDPVDLDQERHQRNFQIRVPNQAEWDAWVDFLKEEKLRALGVTPSNSEAPASTRSPFSASMSRTSSQYPGLAISPPNAPSSVASNPMRLGSNQFSPSFMPSTGVSSQSASIASPLQHPGLPGAVHRYKQSVAQQQMNGRMLSPFDPLGPVMSSSPSYFAQRQGNVSPATLGGLPNLGEILSPVSPFAVDTGPNIGQHNHTWDQMRRQQQELQAHMHQQQQQQVMLNPTLQRQPLHIASSTELNVHPKLEIAHPTPRSHRHNLSEALQKEIDDSKHSTKYQQGLEEPTAKKGIDEQAAGQEDDDEEESLPILKRPETVREDDIITNPSNEPSPLPRDEQDPLSNWKPAGAVDRLKSQPEVGRGHKVQPSMSKLNVQAKEFDPRGVFTSSNFSFGGNAFEPLPRNVKPAPFTIDGSFQPPKPAEPVPRAVSLNVEAPEFTPSFQSNPLPPPRSNTFTFSSVSFNVEAPEFNPSAPPSENFKTSIGAASESTGPALSRIFGDVVIDPNTKPTRRNTKPLPIIRPISKDDSESQQSDANHESEADTAEDEEGRPMAPVMRQKRARRKDSDGNRSPIFADSAPFNHRRILSEIIDDAKENSETVERDATPPVDGWAYVPAEKPEVVDREVVEISAEGQAPRIVGESSSPKDPRSPFAFKNEKDFIETDPAVPQVQDKSAKHQDADEVVEKDELLVEIAHDTVEKGIEEPPTETQPEDKQLGQKSKTSLSALAKPFEFKPATPEHGAQDLHPIAPEPRKTVGLMASRFARSPSPPPPSSSPPRVSSSPPPELYSYIEPEQQILARNQEGTAVNKEDFARRVLASRDGDDELSEEKYEAPLANEESDSMSISAISEHAAEAIPSYEEIDAVMKQFEQNPDLGVERQDSPPVQSTPLIDMRLPPNIRSDAPSPSPRRTQLAEMQRGDSTENEPRSPMHNHGLGIGVHKLTDGTEAVSDWNDTLSPTQEDKLQSRSRFFDGHVNDLVDGILENRLGPLERTMKTIQHSIALMIQMPKHGHGRRTLSIDAKNSDADDEDDYDAFEGFQDYRARSPMSRKDRKPDRVKTAVLEALAAHRPEVPQSVPVDMSEIHAALTEMRQLAANVEPETRQAELKAVVEQVIGTHPRLSGQRVQQAHDGEEKHRLQVNGLETMLKVANERAEEEATARRSIEDELAETRRRLRHAEEDAARYRESSEEAERSFSALVRQKEAYRDLEQNITELNEKNAALESTLDEYRESRKTWQEDLRDIKDKLRDEHMRSEDLERTLRSAQEQLHDRSTSRESLRSTLDRLREEMADLVHNVASERSEWRDAEHELHLNSKILENEFELERRRRERAEHDLHELNTEHKENLIFRSGHAHAQEEISHLQELVASLREENKTHQDNHYKSERELAHAKQTTENEVNKATAQLQVELDRANSQLFHAKTDAEAQIARLQGRVDNAELDLEDQKAKHESLLAETVEAHNQALQEAAEKREAALQEQHATHEKKLADLRDRHTRALHNSSDDRHRLEHHLNEKLALSDDKVQHLESKIQDLEERLAITKSAARAAVEAATAKGINLPTPAPSTVASPPHHPSMSFISGSDIPEKISPQALRESILVLQDQLLNREQVIEKLESELAAVDKEAPKKVQNLETEIGWLRELLSVRVDDIEDLINVLSEPDFDRNSAKDAAIRLRANIQMEQQLKERSASVSGASGLPASISLPSIASLSSTLTQSPRALPMAAAAAWGNWRKARDNSFSALSDLATNLGSQTPSKSTVGSPGSFLSGIMTPPGTSLKSPSPPDFSAAPSAARPLAGLGPGPRKSSGEARPLRAYNSQPRALAKRKDKEPEGSRSAQHRHPESPVTPTLKGRGSLSPNENRDEDDERGFAEDVDEDASPLDGRDRSFGLAQSSDGESLGL